MYRSVQAKTWLLTRAVLGHSMPCYVVAFGRPRPRPRPRPLPLPLPELEPLVGTIEGRPGGLPTGRFGGGAAAGISSSLSVSDTLIACDLLFTGVNFDGTGIVTVGPLLARLDDPTILIFLPFSPLRIELVD